MAASSKAISSRACRTAPAPGVVRHGRHDTRGNGGLPPLRGQGRQLNAGEVAARQVFERICGPGYQDYYDEFRRVRAVRPRPAAMLGDLTTEQVFNMSKPAAGGGQARGGPASLRLSNSIGSRLRRDSSPATACRFPFVFNNHDNWRDSPVLKGADKAGFRGWPMPCRSRMDRIRLPRRIPITAACRTGRRTT